MAISEAFTGTEAVSTTEWSLTTDTAGPDAETSDGIFQAFLDVSDMVAGDILQIRLYETCRSGDTQRLAHEWILTGAQAEPLWVSDSFLLMQGWDWTVLAVAGTITVLWSIRKVA
ncbi:MAG: hypothetical protein H8K07_01690 [Nitrospira sp.]|nr:hypothetical protein [Nitrospira sp.]